MSFSTYWDLYISEESTKHKSWVYIGERQLSPFFFEKELISNANKGKHPPKLGGKENVSQRGFTIWKVSKCFQGEDKTSISELQPL